MKKTCIIRLISNFYYYKISNVCSKFLKLFWKFLSLMVNIYHKKNTFAVTFHLQEIGSIDSMFFCLLYLSTRTPWGEYLSATADSSWTQVCFVFDSESVTDATEIKIFQLQLDLIKYNYSTISRENSPTQPGEHPGGNVFSMVHSKLTTKHPLMLMRAPWLISWALCWKYTCRYWF